MADPTVIASLVTGGVAVLFGPRLAGRWTLRAARVNTEPAMAGQVLTAFAQITALQTELAIANSTLGQLRVELAARDGRIAELEHTVAALVARATTP